MAFVAHSLPTREHPEVDGTRDPIYLFQARRYIWTRDDLRKQDGVGFDFCVDCEGYFPETQWKDVGLRKSREHHHYDEDGNPVQFCTCDDGPFLEGHFLQEGHEPIDRLTMKEVCELGGAVEYWDTELVFFTREEAQDYGKRKHYNYTDGWRTYCVCAEGDLAKILLAHTTRKPPKP